MNPACKEIPEAPDDLAASPVGSWALQKYLLLVNYAQVFATATKFTWQERVYVDLFAGCGKSTIRWCPGLLALRLPWTTGLTASCSAKRILRCSVY